MGTSSLGFQAMLFPNPSWRRGGMKVGQDACKASILEPWCFAPEVNGHSYC